MLSKQLDNKSAASLFLALFSERECKIIMMIKWKFVACVIVGFPVDISQGITNEWVDSFHPFYASLSLFLSFPILAFSLVLFCSPTK